MKKVILCISLVLLCLMLNNCGTNKNELCGLPRRIYNKIQEGYINDITEGRKTEDDFIIDGYFGKFNDAYVVHIRELNVDCPLTILDPLKVAGSSFFLSCDEDILVYYKGELYGLKTAYNKKLLSEDDIKIIDVEYDKYEESFHGGKSEYCLDK